ncbi:hypothetical protein [Halanaerobaculum tunisiense]
MQLKKKILIGFIMLILLAMVGCGQQKSESQSEKSKVPVSFTNVEVTVENMIEDLEDFYLQQKKRQEAKKQQQEATNQNSQQEEKEEGKKEDKEQEEKQKNWDNIQQTIKRIHKKWNRYEGESSVAKEKLNESEQNLIGLTEAAQEKKLLSSLWQTNQFALQLAELYSEYDTKKEVKKKIIAYARKVIYGSWLGIEQEQRLATSDKLKEFIADLKGQVKGTKKEKKIQELEEAVIDLKVAVQEEAREAIKIKGNLIVNKVKNLGD